MAAKARRSRARKDSPSPAPQETSVIEVSVRSGERVVTTVEGAGPPALYDFYGGSYRQISALLGPIVVEKDLSKRACHMLIMLSGQQQRGGAIRLTQVQMAELMISERRPKGWNRVEVNEVLMELRDAGLLYKVGRGHYAFDPQAIFHGTAPEQRSAIANMPEDFPRLQVSETTRRRAR